jgi:hypothetical protein
MITEKWDIPDDWSAYDVLVKELEALHTAIDETCSVTVATEIRRRQAVLLRR